MAFERGAGHVEAGVGDVGIEEYQQLGDGLAGLVAHAVAAVDADAACIRIDQHGAVGSDDARLRAENWRLIGQAREARGDAEGARAALELAERQR